MKDLRNVGELNLEENSLVALPTYLGFLPHLETPAAENMPSLRFPPREVVEGGNPAVLAYLRGQHGEEKPDDTDM
jgi:hypothetical protein